MASSLWKQEGLKGQARRALKGTTACEQRGWGLRLRARARHAHGPSLSWEPSPLSWDSSMSVPCQAPHTHRPHRSPVRLTLTPLLKQSLGSVIFGLFKPRAWTVTAGRLYTPPLLPESGRSPPLCPENPFMAPQFRDFTVYSIFLFSILNSNPPSPWGPPLLRKLTTIFFPFSNCKVMVHNSSPDYTLF